MEAILTPEIWIAMGMSFLSGIIRGFSGFGAAMTLAPVFAILFTAPQAVATMAGLGVLASLQLQPMVLKEVKFREILPIILTALPGIPLGASLLLLLDPELMRRGISAMVLLMVLVLMTGWRYPGKPGIPGTLLTGGISGLINGSTGVGGPPVVLFLLAGPNPAAVNRANMITFYTFINGFTFLSLGAMGIVRSETLWRIALLLPVQVVSLFLGHWLFQRATDTIYRRMAYGVLLVIALFGLVYR